MKNLSLLFLLFTSLLFAQENYISGTVTKNDGTVLNGLINYQDWKVIPDEIKFKIGETVQNFSPTDIIAFEVENDKFISRDVTLDVTEQNLQKLTKRHEPAFEDKRVFLNVLEVGEVNLYEYYDSRPHYFAEKGDELIALTNRILLDFDTGDIKRNKKYRGELNVLLNNCSSITIPNSLEYKRKSLAKIINKYNQCVSGSDDQESYSKDLKAKPGALFVVGGANFSTFKIESIRIYADDFDGGSSINPFFGLGYEMPLSKNRQKWAFYGEVTYNKYKFEENNPREPDMFRVYDPFEIDFSTLNFNILFRYKFSAEDRKLTPYVNFGIGRSFILSQNNKVTETTLSNGERNEIEYEFDNPSQFNYIIGVGANHSKYGLELRYTIYDKLTKVLNETSKLTNLSLVFSYKIL